ncbi:hypothetical protein Tco_0410406 [Tanacetum coccineum]
MVHPTSQVNKVHTDTNQIFDNVNHLLTHEMHQEEHLDSDVESNIDDNTIPLSSVTYLTAKFKCSNLGYRPAPTVHDSEDSLVHAEVSRTKMSERLGTIKPINYAELNALYSHFVPQKELSREQVYWLPAEELATQKRNTPRSIELEELKIYKEATNALMELKNVVLFIERITFNLQLKDQLQGKDDTIKNLHTQINIMRMLNVGTIIGSFDKQALETELSQLKDAITSVRIQMMDLRLEDRRCKITALTDENAKLKTELISKLSSGSIACEKPKVLA